MPVNRPRIDQFLVEQQLCANRDEAQRLIRSGKVLVDEKVIDKPGTRIDPGLPVRLAVRTCPYVSRAGLKMEGAIRRFHLDLQDLVAADLGASTGGFTDCLLQHGVSRVYAVDVGYGLLDYRLQTDARVVVMDRTNCRYLERENLGEAVDLVTADLSFISLKTVFPAVARIVKQPGLALLLVKPQFEIGKGRVGKKGLVKQPGDHVEVLEGTVRFLENQEWKLLDLAPSCLPGKTGNLEFFLLAENRPATHPFPLELIHAAVREAHEPPVPSVPGLSPAEYNEYG